MLPVLEHTEGMSDRDDFPAWVKSGLYEAELALHNSDAAQPLDRRQQEGRPKQRSRL